MSKSVEELLRAADPLPWRLVVLENSVCQRTTAVQAANGKIVADDEPYYPQAISEGNAELIARAVSSFPALLAALKEMRTHADWMGCPRGYDWRDFEPMFAMADTAIALAEGKEQP